MRLQSGHADGFADGDGCAERPGHRAQPPSVADIEMPAAAASEGPKVIDDGWPCLHGPTRNSVSRETDLLTQWPD
jgi:hypothetical protein